MTSTMYASSECSFGLNLKPMCKPNEVSYTIMPNMTYFDFLPHNPKYLNVSSFKDDTKTVNLADVEIGKQYELIVTTYVILYRYKVGDILRVKGFHNATLEFEFVRRKNVLLNIDSDKTDEAKLQKVMENASQLLKGFNTSVVEYTSYGNTNTISRHYVIFWELLGKDSVNPPTDEILHQCCHVMEESLNSVYRQCRVADNLLGPLEIQVVKNRTFEKLMDYAISRGASINQFKMPHCVSFAPMVELLDSSVVSKHFSPPLLGWMSTCPPLDAVSL